MTRANLGEECNCGNCPLFESHICKQLGDRMANCEIVLIERVGCLSHPRAREVLMKDVVEELEKLRADGATKGYTEWPQSALINSISYDDVIKLIRGGKE